MTSRRIKEEKLVVEQMICLYCQKHEGHAELCPSCRELLDYAHSRLDKILAVARYCGGLYIYPAACKAVHFSELFLDNVKGLPLV